MRVMPCNNHWSDLLSRTVPGNWALPTGRPQHVDITMFRCEFIRNFHRIAIAFARPD